MNVSVRKFLKVLLYTAFLLFLSIPTANSQTLKCTGVVDGNTIFLSNGEKVRLIGVGIPATKHSKRAVEYYGNEARAFTRRMVEGKAVRLAYDQQHRDKYGDLLAYVYLTEGTFLNAEIIKQGYGHADTSIPCKYKKEFRQYEKEAQKTGCIN